MTPTNFGRYQIISEIGRGGMATVYQAFDPRFEREVAIKVLPREFLHDPQFRMRFEREAKMVAGLEHASIVPVYDFGEEDGQPYIVMRYMGGGSLEQRLKQGPMPITEVAEIFSRLAPALDAAHHMGIVHRDIKPSNILFDKYGKSFLSDFGIARLVQEGMASITGSAISGTPAYMSPEQVQGDKELDGRSDVYAMGIILFQMLTGNIPYHGMTPAKVMMMHLLDPVPHIRNIKTDLPLAMENIIEQALAKDPDKRFQTAGDLAEQLDTVIHPRVGTPQESQKAPVPQKSSQPAPISQPPPQSPPPASRTPAKPKELVIEPPKGSIGAQQVVISHPGQAPLPAKAAVEIVGPPLGKIGVPSQAGASRSIRPKAGQQRKMLILLGISGLGIVCLLGGLLASVPFLLRGGLHFLSTQTVTATLIPKVAPGTVIPTETPVSASPTLIEQKSTTPTTTLELSQTPTHTLTETLKPSPTASPTSTATNRPQPSATMKRPTATEAPRPTARPPTQPPPTQPPPQPTEPPATEPPPTIPPP